MVVFICDSCGDTLKKQQVDKHVSTRCRGVQRVSCVDCNTVFSIESYRNHTQCISEAERYMGSDYVAKVKKGQLKQEAWTTRVKSALSSSDVHANVKYILEKLLEYDNIPRKQAKFENFMKNSFRGAGMGAITAVWGIINTSTAEEKTEEEEVVVEAKADVEKQETVVVQEVVLEQEVVSTEDGSNKNSEKRSKSKKRKQEGEGDEEAKRKWKLSSIVNGYLEEQGGRVKMRKLELKLVAVYSSGEYRVKGNLEEFSTYLPQQLAALSTVTVEGKYVKLAS